MYIKKLSLTYWIFLLPFLGIAQTISITPNPFDENQEITITVSDFSPQTAWGVSDIYLWAWYFDANEEFAGNPSATGSSFSNSPETAKFTDNGDGTYSFVFVPTDFYDDTDITQVGFLIKSQDGTNQTADFLYDVGSFQLVLNAPTESLTLVDAGDNLSISAQIGSAADFTLSANGTVVNNQSGITDYSYNTIINENTGFILEATNGTDTETIAFQAVIRPNVVEESLPNGLLDGVNLDPNDATKATLVLYAPMKEFVHILGDFNNWTINDAYLMRKDTAQERFWIELTGLTPQFNHLYQYLIEFDINVADPYSTLVLDGFNNDSFIDETTYPNLPEYPTGQTQAITVLRTGDAEYNWQVTNFEKPEKTDLVIYELLVRDFDALHSFDAVKNRLDYLQDLGINAIELMPVNEFDGNESWGYNPSFHMALDKYYGTKDAFKSFVDECHSRGIAVIIDVVYNHATGQHPYYRMWNTDNGGTGGQAASDSPFFNPTATHTFSVFNDFNHQQQATKDYVNRTVTYWIEEFKIDGMRWDLTKGFTQNCTSSDDNCTNGTQPDRITVLQEYADNQWLSDPDFLVIFEHLGGVQEEEQWANYRIDEGKGILLWNKQTDPYNEATMGYHENGKSNFSAVSYQQKGFDQPSAISYMESHDEERLMYKNLEFGNSINDYDVTELDTALERIQTAGAFFFTVPGPKMIWQFGELGYDISINQNGRTGNKPILWEYANDPNRFVIYETWQDLIRLKLEEPIFKTNDFILNLGASTGLKSIHLSDNIAVDDAIKHVTIIGNFDIEEQSINPNFQEVGTWYNLLKANEPLAVNAVDDPILLQPGEFMVFANNPSLVLIDPNDLDADGVPNEDDLCPDSPFGSTVDVTGCEIFTLDASNYRLNTTSETCRNADNGKIEVLVETLLDYTVSVTGPDNFEVTENFTTDTWRLEGVIAGNYSVCFSVTGESGYEQCFDVTISQPEDLSVASKVDRSVGKVSLELSGSDLYFVTLNGITQETFDESLTINLENGTNTVQVATAKDCQGIYEETIVVLGKMNHYPNPVTSDFSVYVPGDVPRAIIAIYGPDGKLLSSESKTIQDNRLIDISLALLSQGYYFVNINGEIIKVIKR